MPLNSANPELRIIRLEETAYFQEEKLAALDGELLAQQARIADLEKKLKKLSALVDQIRDALADKNAPANEVPPHYQQKPW